jgi:hypothetical protein
MAGYPGYVSVLDGFSQGDYCVGANGQMAGGFPQFTALALFATPPLQLIL